ncbi:MAG: ATP-binding protein [Thermodesulfobacteriota bacterium]
MDADTLRALWAVLTAVRESTGYPEFLAHVAQAVTESVRSDRTTLYILSRRRRAFLPAADYGTPAPVVQAFVRRGFTPGTFPGEALLRAGRSVLAIRGRAPELEETLEQARLHALLAVPLVYREELEGVLSCGVEDPPAFSDAQVQLVEQLAPQLALLIRSARLEAEKARLAERRTRLASLASEVLTAADADAMAVRLCAASRAIFRATRAVLLMLEDGVLHLRGVDGGDVGEAPLRLPLAEAGVLADCLRERRVLVVNEFMSSPHAPQARARNLAPASFLAIPLADGEGDLGLLVVTDRDEPFRFGPLDEEDGRLLGTIATDSIRKRLLVEALRRANTAKSEFLASVSHDLRTPLNVILGYTDLLADETFGPVTAEQLDTLGRIRRTAAEQLALINDLLDLARIEQGKVACRLQSVHVGELVGSLREMMDALLRDRPVAFEVDVAADAVASTDRERLRQVLVNLLANAAKFTHEGRVRLAALRTDGAVEISVADTGPGMDAALADQMLEPFVHGSSEHAGTGLGLAIVSRLLNVLGGRLEIDSALGRGTTVRVRLPSE